MSSSLATASAHHIFWVIRQCRIGCNEVGSILQPCQSLTNASLHVRLGFPQLPTNTAYANHYASITTSASTSDQMNTRRRWSASQFLCGEWRETVHRTDLARSDEDSHYCCLRYNWRNGDTLIMRGTTRWNEKRESYIMKRVDSTMLLMGRQPRW